MAKLTAKQARFVEEYLVDLNATQAAIRAGYSERSAKVTGHRLLTNANLARAIHEAQSARSERVEVDQDWIIERLVENVDRSMQLEPVLDHEGKPTGEYRYAGNVANRALELLGKHFGMFVERTQNYEFDPDDFTDEGLQRIEHGEDPVHVLVTGGRRASDGE